MKTYEIFGKKLKHNDLLIIFCVVGLIIMLLGSFAIYDILTPSTSMKTTPLPFGFEIGSFMPTFLGICIGIGWMINGVGFRIL